LLKGEIHIVVTSYRRSEDDAELQLINNTMISEYKKLENTPGASLISSTYKRSPCRDLQPIYQLTQYATP